MNFNTKDKIISFIGGVTLFLCGLGFLYGMGFLMAIK